MLLHFNLKCLVKWKKWKMSDLERYKVDDLNRRLSTDLSSVKLFKISKKYKDTLICRMCQRLFSGTEKRKEIKGHIQNHFRKKTTLRQEIFIDFNLIEHRNYHPKMKKKIFFCIVAWSRQTFWFNLDFLLPKTIISSEYFGKLVSNISSTDFIFIQQENLVDNQKCKAGFRQLCIKILI